MCLLHFIGDYIAVGIHRGTDVRVPHQLLLYAVLEYARAGKILGEVECLPLGDANAALERLRHGEVCGRLVLRP